MVKKYLSRLNYAWQGIVHAFKHDSSYRSQLYLGVAVAILVSLLFRPLTSWEFLFIILAWALILITELQNSALEAALDQLHPERHDNIKHSKDLVAGAVLTAGLFLLLTLVVIGWSRF